MHKIDGVGNSNNQFVAGNPEQGILPTRITPEWLNAIQGELAHVIAQAGVELDKADNTQLAEAIAWYVAQGGSSYTHPEFHSADEVNETEQRKWFSLDYLNTLNSKADEDIAFSGAGVSGILIPVDDVTRIKFNRVAPKGSASKLRWKAILANGSDVTGTYYAHNAETAANYGEIISRYAPTVPADSVGFTGRHVLQRDKTSGQVGAYNFIIQKRTGHAYQHHNNISGTSPSTGFVASILYYWDTGSDFTDDSMILKEAS